MPTKDDESAPGATDRELGSTPRRMLTTIGTVLIALSGVLWFSLFAVPFLPFSISQKAATGGGIFVGVQIAWWSGAALVGPQATKSFREWFRAKRGRSSAS